MNEFSVLLVGRCQNAAHGADAAAWLAEVERWADCEQVEDVRAAALQLADRRRNFHLIVLAESRPGEFPAARIDQLRQMAPLARVWRLLGGWCEGERRSGRPPEGCAWSYWHQWRERFAREATTAREGRCPLWGLPLSATAEERALAAADLPIEQRSGLVVVCADRSEAAAALADVCRLGGYDARVVREADSDAMHGAGVQAVVWDTSVQRACDPQHVGQIRRRTGGAPLVAVVGFPRPLDRQRALAAGVQCVISKPLAIGDLLWCLGETPAELP